MGQREAHKRLQGELEAAAHGRCGPLPWVMLPASWYWSRGRLQSL